MHSCADPEWDKGKDASKMCDKLPRSGYTEITV
jgi:hypothetical protein